VIVLRGIASIIDNEKVPATNTAAHQIDGAGSRIRFGTTLFHANE
jgi:hypothetical protein